MIKLIKTPLQKSLVIIGSIVDCYGLYQMSQNTNLNFNALVNNPWFQLVILGTLFVIGLLIYFKEREKVKEKTNELQKYRERTGEHINKLYGLIDDLYNKNYWEIDTIKGKL